MATTIKIKNSVTATTTPTSLVQGEVAINVTDKKVWVGNAATTPIQIVGAGTTGNAAGSNTQVQYNSSGSFAGDADFTFNGTTVTMANDASISGLTVGKGGGAVATNTTVGSGALAVNTTGQRNVAVGRSTLAANTTGDFNTAVGDIALQTNTTGQQNIAVGIAALNVNTTGSNNVAVGSNALVSNTTASNNTAVGYQAGYTNTTGASNTLLGQTAGYANSTGSGLVAVGFEALRNTTASDNTAVGVYAMKTNTTGQYNTALGGGQFGSNWGALGYNTTGSNNTAVGFMALLSNTTASQNTAVGYQAGSAITTSSESTYLGYQAGVASTGIAVTLLGRLAGRDLTSGTNNTFVGHNSGLLMTTGSKNTILGSYNGNQGGLDLRTANNHIVLSDGDGNPRQFIDSNGNTYLGKVSSSDAVVGNYLPASGLVSFSASQSTSAASTLNIYSTGASAYRFYVSMDGKIYCTSTTIAGISDQRLKENVRDLDTGLDAIMAVKPRRFDWKEGKGQNKKNAVGFVAQEFETVFPDSVNPSKAGEDGIEYKTVCHEELIPAMVKAIQELKAEVDSLKAQLNNGA